MLITKKVKIRWHSSNKKWYINKGYIFTKIGEEFDVKILDLTNGSTGLVKIQCDGCGKILENIRWKDYLKHKHKNNRYYCHKCSMQLFGGEKLRKTQLKNSKSFEQWCLENDRQDVLDRWDYNKNVNKNNKALTPKDISYSSSGLNRIGYWFKCLDHPEHGSEQKDINTFTNGFKGTINCDQCHTIAITHPHLTKYFVNKEDVYKYSFGSHYCVLMKCPDCGHEKLIKINTLSSRGFGCIYCNDGISYPEKFMFNALEQLNINFIHQLTKKNFNWCNGYRYDFYIKLIDSIIETHGFQHYGEIKGSWECNLKETQENDKNKEQLAIENNIKHYIIVDCRESNMEWIQKSIMQSELPTLLNFKEDDIDWLKCHESACKNLVKTTCDLWNSGMKNALEIANTLKINRATIISYLKKGKMLQWCDYNPKKESEKVILDLQKRTKIKIICLTTNKIFNSIMEASKEYKTNNTGIGRCCKNKQKTSGKHPITGEYLEWMFYDEYINLINRKDNII